MATTKTINTRIVQKHAPTEDWEKASGFSPLQSEFICFDDDPRLLKVGEGPTVNVNNVAFLYDKWFTYLLSLDKENNIESEYLAKTSDISTLCSTVFATTSEVN